MDKSPLIEQLKNGNKLKRRTLNRTVRCESIILYWVISCLGKKITNIIIQRIVIQTLTPQHCTHGRIDHFEEEYIAARAIACVCITYCRNCIIDTIKSRAKQQLHSITRNWQGEEILAVIIIVQDSEIFVVQYFLTINSLSSIAAERSRYMIYGRYRITVL